MSYHVAIVTAHPIRYHALAAPREIGSDGEVQQEWQ
jgi:hypothetical protein